MRVLQTAHELKEGILFDNHFGNEEAFSFCERHGHGYIVTPMGVGENERLRLVDDLREQGIWTAYIFGRANGDFDCAFVKNEDDARKVEEVARSRWTEAKELFEPNARLIHDLATRVGEDPLTIAEAHAATLSLSEDKKNSFPAFFFEVLPIILKLRSSSDSNSRSGSKKFYKELVATKKTIPDESVLPLGHPERIALEEYNRIVEKGWLNKVYDLELLRYTKAYKNITLCSNDAVVQAVADELGLKRIADLSVLGSN